MLDVNFDSLLSGAVGGVLILLLTILYNGWQEKQSRNRELRGLLLLVNAEIGINNQRAQTAIDNSSMVNHPSLVTPRSNDWDQSKVRVAQLLPGQDTAVLVAYYDGVRVIAQSVSEHESEKTTEEDLEVIGDLMSSIKLRGRAVQHMLGQYLGSSADLPAVIKVPEQ